MEKTNPLVTALVAGLAIACAAGMSPVQASSHAEAPFITRLPKVDGTDFYMFRSYEEGKADTVTILANYFPLQAPWGGPSYFALSDDALYEIHIDNDGDVQPDITFQFRFKKAFRNIALQTGTTAQGDPINVPIPLIISGTIGQQTTDPQRNRIESYTLRVVRDGNPQTADLMENGDGEREFLKPLDNIGQKTFGPPGSYQNYARQFIYDFTMPGCSAQSRVFVGQRREGFYVNLGETFDLLNIEGSTAPIANMIGGRDNSQNVTDIANITTLALEVPIDCLTTDGDGSGIIGGWTESFLPKRRDLFRIPVVRPTDFFGRPEQGNPDDGLFFYSAAQYVGRFAQVSRLGHPLVNEVVIGLPDKNRFNASNPVNDVRNFGNYVLYPTFPVLAAILFPAIPDDVVPETPRLDLAAVYITGLQVQVDGQPFDFTHPPGVSLEPPFEGGGEMLRLNTTIPVTMDPAVGNLGVLECDLAGFPNGRRPVDDVVDITLTVALGALLPNDEGLGGVYELQYCNVDTDPETSGLQPAVFNEGAVITDGTTGSPELFMTRFPYLSPPLPGSPNEADGQGPDGATTVPQP